jgi:hypothetical protein
VIVSNTRSIGQIIMGLYITFIMVLFIWLPMIKLHGYRQWWVDLFYGSFAFGVVGGSVSRYRMVRGTSRPPDSAASSATSGQDEPPGVAARQTQ